jgi:hypothetical protein
MKYPTIEETRKWLKAWDDGLITEAEFDTKVSAIFVNVEEWVDLLEKGEEILAFGSCCCSSHKPDKTVEASITIQPHGYLIKKIPKPIKPELGNSCNRHSNCAAAKQKAVQDGKNPYIICCHDECCEDCFGS